MPGQYLGSDVRQLGLHNRKQLQYRWIRRHIARRYAAKDSRIRVHDNSHVFACNREPQRFVTPDFSQQ